MGTFMSLHIWEKYGYVRQKNFVFSKSGKIFKNFDIVSGFWSCFCFCFFLWRLFFGPKNLTSHFLKKVIWRFLFFPNFRDPSQKLLEFFLWNKYNLFTWKRFPAYVLGFSFGPPLYFFFWGIFFFGLFFLAKFLFLIFFMKFLGPKILHLLFKKSYLAFFVFSEF